jgi:hypothetical protein
MTTPQTVTEPAINPKETAEGLGLGGLICSAYSLMPDDGHGPWISKPGNGGDVGELAEIVNELNMLRSDSEKRAKFFLLERAKRDSAERAFRQLLSSIRDGNFSNGEFDTEEYDAAELYFHQKSSPTSPKDLWGLAPESEHCPQNPESSTPPPSQTMTTPNPIEEPATPPEPNSATGGGCAATPCSTVCGECNWSNGELWNLGDFGKPRWVCQGCAKRSLEASDARSNPKLNSVCEITKDGKHIRKHGHDFAPVAKCSACENWYDL